MKKVLIIISILYATNTRAQAAANTSAIEEAALNYVKGFYTGDTIWFFKKLSSERVKNLADNHGGSSKLVIGLKDLIMYANATQNKPCRNLPEPFITKIEICDIDGGIAIAKITTNKFSSFFDYVQVDKINGEWKIINVLWTFYK